MTCPYCCGAHSLSQCPRWKLKAWLVELWMAKR